MMKSIKYNLICLFLFLFLKTFSNCSEIKYQTPSKEIRMFKIEIKDSIINSILDSVIEYENHCFKNKKKSIYYEIFSIHRRNQNGNLSFSIISKFGKFINSVDSTIKTGVLMYKNRYFIFHEFDNIIGLDSLLNVTSNQLIINLTNHKFIGIGKTYSSFSIEITSSSSFSINSNCLCNYGNTHAHDYLFIIKRFFYNIFCPCRGKRKM